MAPLRTLTSADSAFARFNFAGGSPSSWVMYSTMSYAPGVSGSGWPVPASLPAAGLAASGPGRPLAGSMKGSCLQVPKKQAQAQASTAGPRGRASSELCTESAKFGRQPASALALQCRAAWARTIEVSYLAGGGFSRSSHTTVLDRDS